MSEYSKEMNAAWRRLRRFGRTTGARTRSAADCCINSTASMESDPLRSGSADGIARLSSKGEMSCFSFGGRNIRFRTSPRLSRYREVLSWENGFIEVLAEYGDKVEEEYIDLVSILENLYIDPKSYLASIKKVEVLYV